MGEPQTEKTVATYNAIAPDYEQKSFQLDASIDLPEFTSHLEKGSRVLDAGCGYGRELKHFIDSGFDTYGIDLSAEMLKLAKGRNPQAYLAKMPVDNLDFPDGQFDGVWCRGVLHHLPRPQITSALKEIGRVLKPNGILFIHCREGEGEVVLKEDLSSGLERIFTQVSEEELRTMVTNAGFEVIKSYAYNENERYGKGREDANFVVVIGRKAN